MILPRICVWGIPGDMYGVFFKILIKNLPLTTDPDISRVSALSQHNLTWTYQPEKVPCPAARTHIKFWGSAFLESHEIEFFFLKVAKFDIISKWQQVLGGLCFDLKGTFRQIASPFITNIHNFHNINIYMINHGESHKKSWSCQVSV